MGSDMPPNSSSGPGTSRDDSQYSTEPGNQATGWGKADDGLPDTVNLDAPPAPNIAAHEETVREPEPEAASGALADRIGRFRVIRRLGRGGFGTVFLGHDEQMDRPVAIKVPRDDQLDSDQSVAAFLSEARHVSKLKHAGIVTIFDFGQADGQCYLVYEFIEGMSVAEFMRRGSLAFADVARIVAESADALDYAHAEGVYHRDIKPSNILLDREGRAHVTDFGLAVREEELVAERGRQSGTEPYMSPEQVRGEGHRIDGRTDIYSLGVMLYEMLCGRRPFEGKSRDVMFDEILNRDPRPPRQIKHAIPRELERICLKAMARRTSERYTTASDLAYDLRAAAASLPGAGDLNITPASTRVEPPPSGRVSDSRLLLPVVPKGLRPFDPEDSDFFLQLLPGPRNREGLPDSIRFWKSRIESNDPDTTFAVGLIYGPSGCGKSSLVRAGLLPRLIDSVRKVYLEATREDTEARLVKLLRKECPELAECRSLRDMMVALRRGKILRGGQKVLIVVDQFEQWLHEHSHEMEASELVAALRQVDGEHVQVLLLVRDDFWMAVSRLFQCLEIHLEPERNTRPADLFDLRHARLVLLQFGQAFDQLPANSTDLTGEQQKFLDQAVHELSEAGRVICVRLSLFAELMRERPWTLESLIDVGGTEGVAVRFLEESFTGRAAVPEFRALENSARAVLHALLPETGTEIRGQLRSRQDLAAACGLSDTSPQLDRLLRILDNLLHLITPTEQEVEGQESRVEGQKVGGEVSQASGPQPSTLDPRPSFYQLTHDFLVPPLRQWLTLERRKTWRGRAELCLEERTAQMSRWPKSRFLPTIIEYLTISMGVPRRRRKSDQRALMRKAMRFYSLRGGALIIVVLLLAFIIQVTANLGRVDGLVSALLRASPDGVQAAIVGLEPFRQRAIPVLQRHFVNQDRDSTERLRAACALAALDKPDHNFLIAGIATASPAECRNLFRALAPSRQAASTRLLDFFNTETDAAIRVRYATALLNIGEPQAAMTVLKFGPDPTLRTTFIHVFPSCFGSLALLPDLLRENRDASFQSGLCAALGKIKPDVLDSDERAVLAFVLRDLYRTAPNGGTHSAAGWALAQWDDTLPAIEPSDRPVDNRRWFVNHQGMTMVEIPRPTSEAVGSTNSDATTQPLMTAHPLFMSDQEVSTDLFRKFLNDPNYPVSKKPQYRIGPNQAISPSGKHPVQKISCHDAMLFCNWLSEKHGLQPCYERTEKRVRLQTQMFGDGPRGGERKGKEVEVWRWHPERNSYRLSTRTEWDTGCRAGTITKFSFGDENPLNPSSYAVFGRQQTASVGSLLPNDWGLFDMHGNVGEYSWDWREYPKESPDAPAELVPTMRWPILGGYYEQNLDTCCSASPLTWEFDPTSRDYKALGFRVLCGAAN